MSTERRTDEGGTVRRLQLLPLVPQVEKPEWDEAGDFVVDLAAILQREKSVSASRSCHPAGSNRASSTRGKIA